MADEMKHHCNPLLKSWNDYMKDAAKFVVLRRDGHAVIASNLGGRRIKKKARR